MGGEACVWAMAGATAPRVKPPANAAPLFRNALRAPGFEAMCLSFADRSTTNRAPEAESIRPSERSPAGRFPPRPQRNIASTASKRPEYRHTGRLLISRRSHMTKLFPFARVVTAGFVGAVTLCVGLDVQTSAQDASRLPSASAASRAAAAAATPASSRGLIDRYCVTCHNERLKTADLTLDRLDVANPGAHADVWEKVVRKVHTGTMPPASMPQPSQDDRRALLTWLETS